MYSFNDDYFMGKALELAAKGRCYTSPNPMVGAVVVKAGKIVGQGYHQACGRSHAEVNAIDDAGTAAQDATLYVTLEPCNHQGRTPPCTEKIIAAGIRRVVAAMEDPNPVVKGGGLAYLAERGLTVEVGVGQDKAICLNEVFIKWIITGLPFVVLKCASTLDGQIATRTGDSRWITNVVSRQYVHTMRRELDAILVGVDTIKNDNPRLTARIEGLEPRDPIRLILDTRLTIPLDATVLNQPSNAETWVITGNQPDAQKKASIEAKGAKVIEAETVDGVVDFGRLMPQLGSLGITSILIEGGSKIIGSALKAGVVDRLNLFFAPKILGGNDGIPLCRGKGAENMSEALSLQQIRVTFFEEDVMIEGYVKSIKDILRKQ